MAERWTTDNVDVFDADGNKVCHLHRSSRDGRIIAAAPAMLEALSHAQAILPYCRQFSTNQGGAGPSTTTQLALQKVLAAIRLAEPEGTDDG